MYQDEPIWQLAIRVLHPLFHFQQALWAILWISPGPLIITVWNRSGIGQILGNFGKMLGESLDKIGPKCLNALIRYDWPQYRKPDPVFGQAWLGWVGKLLHCGKVAQLWFNPPRYQNFLNVHPLCHLYFKNFCRVLLLLWTVTTLPRSPYFSDSLFLSYRHLISLLSDPNYTNIS